MKYLKKFINESYHEYFPEELDYIKSCFVDYIDNGKVSINVTEYDTIELDFQLPSLKREKTTSNWESITDYINYHNNIANYLKDIEECVEKVNMKYTEYKIENVNEDKLRIVFIF